MSSFRTRSINCFATYKKTEFFQAYNFNANLNRKIVTFHLFSNILKGTFEINCDSRRIPPSIEIWL